MKRLLALLLIAVGCDAAAPPPAPPAPAPGSDKPLLNPEHPEMKKQAPASYTVRFNTSRGDFVVRVTRDWAPVGADRFYNLVRHGFYDGCRFFRVVPGFMVQFGLSGDPSVSAAWKEANLQDDPVKESNQRGFICYAKTGAPNSRSTQVFINYGDNSRLDKDKFAPFGKVIGGMEVVDEINAEYREQPRQDLIQSQGTSYLMQQFPKLDFITSATVGE